MKTVSTKQGFLTFINNPEAKVFDKVKCCDFVPVNSLSESEKYNADQLVQKNVLEKVNYNEKIGYRAFSRKIQL